MEPPVTPVHPLQLACGGWIASALSEAARLGIADLLHAGPRSAAALAGDTGTEPEMIARLLDTLALFGLFARDADDAFVNTAASDLLRDAHPDSVRHFCMLAAGDYQRVFLEIAHSVRTGRPATGVALGGTLYDHLQANPEAARVYDRAMEDLARPVGRALAADPRWQRASRVVDVGGGGGAIALALVAAHPHLSAVVADRADVCARAEARLAGMPEAAARLRFEPADMFAEVPAGADVYLLKNVLHNWSDAQAVRVLATIRRAMPPDSELLVIEPASGSMPPIYERLDALLQAVVCDDGSLVRTVEHWTGLLRDAGFSPGGVQRLATGHLVMPASPL